MIQVFFDLWMVLSFVYIYDRSYREVDETDSWRYKEEVWIAVVYLNCSVDIRNDYDWGGYLRNDGKNEYARNSGQIIFLFSLEGWEILG